MPWYTLGMNTEHWDIVKMVSCTAEMEATHPRPVCKLPPATVEWSAFPFSVSLPPSAETRLRLHLGYDPTMEDPARTPKEMGLEMKV